MRHVKLSTRDLARVHSQRGAVLEPMHVVSGGRTSGLYSDVSGIYSGNKTQFRTGELQEARTGFECDAFLLSFAGEDATKLAVLRKEMHVERDVRNAIVSNVSYPNEHRFAGAEAERIVGVTCTEFE